MKTTKDVKAGDKRKRRKGQETTEPVYQNKQKHEQFYPKSFLLLNKAIALEQQMIKKDLCRDPESSEFIKKTLTILNTTLITRNTQKLRKRSGNQSRQRVLNTRLEVKYKFYIPCTHYLFFSLNNVASSNKVIVISMFTSNLTSKIFLKKKKRCIEPL